jgi:hypothetical protein
VAGVHIGELGDHVGSSLEAYPTPASRTKVPRDPRARAE